MQMDDMILVSIDDHMVEPPDMYKNHVPAKWQDQAPKVVRNDAGHRRVGVPGRGDRRRRSAWPPPSGWPREEWGFNPGSYTELRPGCFDVHERVRDMNANGVLASMCFPTMAGLQRPHVHRGAATRSCRSSCCRPTTTGPSTSGAARTRVASSRWASSRCGTSTSPSRRSTASARRAAGRSASSRRRTPRASRASCPATGTRCSGDVRREHGPVAAHRRRVRPHQEGPRGADRPPHRPHLPDLGAHRAGPAVRPDAAPVPRPQGRAVRGRHRLDPVLPRPRRPPLPEPGVARSNDFGGKLPSDVFRDHILACYITDPSGLELRHRIGIDIIAWECDYPHTDTTWPESPEFAWKEFQDAGCTDEEIHKITWENSCRFFDWDPFEHTPEGAGDGRRAARAWPPTSTPPACRARSGASATRPPASASSDRVGGGSSAIGRLERPRTLLEYARCMGCISSYSG